jgi:hypothetical protein
MPGKITGAAIRKLFRMAISTTNPGSEAARNRLFAITGIFIEARHDCIGATPRDPGQ